MKKQDWQNQLELTNELMQEMHERVQDLTREVMRLSSRVTQLESILDFMDMNDVTEYLDAQVFEVSMSDLDKKILIQKRRTMKWGDK
jgi:phage shock protein A